MSIKIYEAWRFNEGLAKLLPMLTAFHDYIVPKQKDSLNQAFARKIARQIDYKDPDRVGLYEMIRLQIKAEKTGEDGVVPNVTWNVTLFPYRGKTLILFYGPKWIREELVSFLGVEEFGYWNNTDRPEGVTPQQWRYRRKVWDQVLTGDDLSGVPANLGFTYEPAFSWGALFEKDIVQCQPSPEERAEKRLLDELFYLHPDSKEKEFWKLSMLVAQLEKDIQEVRTLKNPEDPRYQRLCEIAATLKPLTIEDL